MDSRTYIETSELSQLLSYNKDILKLKKYKGNDSFVSACFVDDLINVNLN